MTAVFADVPADAVVPQSGDRLQGEEDRDAAGDEQHRRADHAEGVDEDGVAARGSTGEPARGR